MNDIILTRDGELMQQNGSPAPDALTVLGARLELGEGVCLRSVLQLLARRPELQRLSEFGPGLAAQLAAWPAEGCLAPGLECLEFARVVEVIGHPLPARLEVYHVLRGRLAPGGDEGGADVEIKSWQVEQLLDVPLVLGPLRHVVFGDRMDTTPMRADCTLFDLLDGVVWQLAFHSTPRECALRR